MKQNIPTAIRKKRGKFLTTLIVIGIVFLLYDFINKMSGYDYLLPKARTIITILRPQVAWDPLNLLFYASALCYYIAYYGIWTWKKWGVYVLCVLFGLSFIPDIVNIIHTPNGIAAQHVVDILNALFYVIVFYLLWFWAIKRKWHLFT